ncbi:MAG: Ig-like domain-containing protein [Lachnospiraceae bacterium]|nr:Ig-like domain-containing protein [Lachnospiraceae bacterium]
MKKGLFKLFGLVIALVLIGSVNKVSASTSLPSEFKDAPKSVTVDAYDSRYGSRIRVNYTMTNEFKKLLEKDDDISYDAQIDWKFSENDDWKYSDEWDQAEKKVSSSSWEFVDSYISLSDMGGSDFLFDFDNEEDSSWYEEGYSEAGWSSVVPKKYLIKLKRLEADEEEYTSIDWNKVSVDIRVRFYARQWDSDLDEDVYVFTPWSDVVTYGNFSKDYDNIDNLLENPDFEYGIKGWKDPDKVWGPEISESSYTAQHGRFFVWGINSSELEEDKDGVARTRIYQDVSLENYKADETVVFNTLLCNYDQAPHDMGKVTLVFYDKDGKSIESYSQSQRNPNWNSQTIICSIPEGAVKVRVNLWAYRYVGSDIDAYYDYCSLVVKPEKINPVIVTESKNKSTAKKGDKIQLKAYNKKTSDASDYTWSSSYNTAATVDANGLVTFHTDAEDGVAIYAKDNNSGVTGVYWFNSNEETNAKAEEINDGSGKGDNGSDTGDSGSNIGDNGSGTSTIDKPVAAKLKKVSKAKKAFTAKWAKVKGVDGYEIQYSLNKKMKDAVVVDVDDAKATSKKITDLKGGKKYYVQIRTYIVVDGKKVYSDWSKVKKVKTKK